MLELVAEAFAVIAAICWCAQETDLPDHAANVEGIRHGRRATVVDRATHAWHLAGLVERRLGLL